MRRFARSRRALTALAAAGSVAAAETAAKAPPAYAPPPETSKFVAAPGVELAQRYCLTCHSADYVSTQPPHMPAAFWQNEVAKMRNAYGATIPDDAAKAISDYLAATYAEPTRGGR
ncbi:MAG: SorB family sulfite dehydrogenase c-type cytochrome subunit [Phenylobacterium sp.]